jgi:hypothetical protein
MFIAGSLLSAPNSQAGQIPLKSSPLERQNTVELNLKRYVAAGDRAYIVGVQDGSMVPSMALNPPKGGIGWHITGQMGGVWAHPIKLIHDFQFLLNGNPLPAATKFVSGTGYIWLELPSTEGLEISETRFAPDGLPVVLLGVQLRSSSPGIKSVTLGIEAQSELIAAYPWSGTTPTSESLHQQDQDSYDSETGALRFTQPAQSSWYALVSAALDREDRATGFEPLGASGLGPAGSHNGAGGTLTYRVTLGQQRSATVWFAIAGSNVGKEEAVGALKVGLAFPEALLDAKFFRRQQVLSQARIQVPDEAIQAAFDWGKLNLADMSRTVRNVEGAGYAGRKGVPGSYQHNSDSHSFRLRGRLPGLSLVFRNRWSVYHLSVGGSWPMGGSEGSLKHDPLRLADRERINGQSTPRNRHRRLDLFWHQHATG